MKFLIIFALLISAQTFAADICHFEETSDFFSALEAEGIKPYKKSKNHKRFTFIEKQMIHLTVTLQDYLRGATKEESLLLFGDYYEGEIGSNAGEILYFKIADKDFALVHYWPGDNEYGAYYEVKNSAFRLVADIEDSFINCHK